MGSELPQDKFKKQRMGKSNPKYKIATKRKGKLYSRGTEAREEFTRDYTRILHSWGFRRLRHKTQVFFKPENDHICTRLEHALHVSSISSTICDMLGLNSNLARAIAIGHDLGHAPFGHHGEKILNSLIEKHGMDGQSFWHEKHGLRVVDKIETVKDDKGYQQNLRLTYAVRDGIICHCGEKEDVYESPIYSRDEEIDLNNIAKKEQYQPFSWEGCVVKISDIISYLGRDLEDAEICNIIDDKGIKVIKDDINSKTNLNIKDLSNGVIINQLIIDLIQNSSIDEGLTLSEDGRTFAKILRGFNYKKIYENEMLDSYKNYISLVLETIFNKLRQQYTGDIYETIEHMRKKEEDVFEIFVKWLEKYQKDMPEDYKCLSSKFIIQKTDKIYDIKNIKDYSQAIIDYIAGFTDNFASTSFQQLISVV